jgi:AcrR family transcriptional regulator
MPRRVDTDSRGREIQAATLRVIARYGVSGVTVRRVASELGASTSVITHFTRDKDDLLAQAVAAGIDEFQLETQRLIVNSEDPLWAVLQWSLNADTTGVWPALVLATLTDIPAPLIRILREFDVWWTDTVTELVTGRSIEGLSARDAADAMGVVVDGLILTAASTNWTFQHRWFIARRLIEPLLAA